MPIIKDIKTTAYIQELYRNDNKKSLFDTKASKGQPVKRQDSWLIQEIYTITDGKELSFHKKELGAYLHDPTWKTAKVLIAALDDLYGKDKYYLLGNTQTIGNQIRKAFFPNSLKPSDYITVTVYTKKGSLVTTEGTSDRLKAKVQAEQTAKERLLDLGYGAVLTNICENYGIRYNPVHKQIELGNGKSNDGYGAWDFIATLLEKTIIKEAAEQGITLTVSKVRRKNINGHTTLIDVRKAKLQLQEEAKEEMKQKKTN